MSTATPELCLDTDPAGGRDAGAMLYPDAFTIFCILGMSAVLILASDMIATCGSSHSGASRFVLRLVRFATSMALVSFEARGSS